MDCASVCRQLPAYIDGDLPSSERRAFQSHLETCAACRAEWALLQEVDEALSTWPVLAEPEGLAARVMSEIRASGSRREARQHLALRVRWQDALLGLALALTVVMLFVSVRYTWRASIVEWRALDLQAQHSLSTIERAWYATRAEARHVQADVSRVFGWVSSGLVLVAAAVTAVVLALQWPGGAFLPFRQGRR